MGLKFHQIFKELNSKRKIIFEPKVKFFYKHEYSPEEIWINKEVMVQLNITPKCPLNCSFCYIKKRYNCDLSFKKIVKLFNNLEKYNKKLKIVYRVNLTGGDIFYYYKIEELLKLLKNSDYVVAVDPLINRLWNNRTKKLLELIMDKITYIQMNVSVVKKEDLDYAKEARKIVLLKYPIYKRHEKKMIEKIIRIMKTYENVWLSFDWIIPQDKEYAKYCYVSDISDGINEARKIIELIKKENLDDRIFTTSCIIEREIFGRTYLCGVGIQNIYVMPDGKIAVCSRYPFLETKYSIDNFDLIEYFTKFQKLISNTCLFENKYFTDFWKIKENPRYWQNE
ncbi:MAG: radical SAM protein [Candidatus Aenigmatarchaeota archaeon]